MAHCSLCLSPNPGTCLKAYISFYPDFRASLTHAHGLHTSQHPLPGSSWLRLHLVSKAEVSGPEAGVPRGTSYWAIVPLGRTALAGAGDPRDAEQKSSGCSGFPHLPSMSLLCKQGSAWCLLLITVWKSGGTRPGRAGIDTWISHCQQAAVFLVYVGQKNKKTRWVSILFLFTWEAFSTTVAALGPLLTRGYQTVHQALVSTHPLGHL